MTEQTVTAISVKYRTYLTKQQSEGLQARLLSERSPEETDQFTNSIFPSLIEIDKDALKYGSFALIKNALNSFAGIASINIDTESDNYYLLLRLALQQRIAHLETLLQRAKGNYEDPLKATSPAVGGMTAQTELQSSLTIGELCDAYVQDKFKTEGAWDEHGTLTGVQQALMNFRTIIGGDDVPAHTINRMTLNAYKTKLAELPNQKLPKYSGKSMAQLIALTNVPEAHCIKKGTVNNQLIWVAAMQEWASMNDYIAKNYAKGLIIKRTTVDKNRKKDCLPYTHDEIKKIVENLPYNPLRPERFWAPIIAAYTSARLNEAAQLLLSDICVKNGLLCFKIIIEDTQDSDPNNKKKLKTQASKRVIPIHNDLLELGFMNYVDDLRKLGAVRLFPKLPVSKRGHGVELGKWYGREVTKKFFPKSNRLKVFNSFRHSVENVFKNTPDMRDSLQSYLCGHATGKEDFDRYGSDPLAPVLKEYVDKINYNIDLERVKENMRNPVIVSRGCNTKAISDAKKAAQKAGTQTTAKKPRQAPGKSRSGH